MEITVSKYQINAPGNTLSEKAVHQALKHYESEAKSGKEYAKPIAVGLDTAMKELQKYHELVNMIVVK